MGAEQQHEISQIKRQAEGGNKIEYDEVQPLKCVGQALEAMEESQFTIHHETDSQRITIPARALAQQTYAVGGAVGLRPGLRHETDRITEATQPQAELQILAWADVESALPEEYTAPIHRTGAG